MNNMQPLEVYAKNTKVLQLSSDGYEFQPTDKLYFTAKPKPDNDQTDADAVIKKEFANFTTEPSQIATITLEAEDTDIDYGCYFYDIKLVAGDVSQTIVAGKLNVLPVATLRS